MSYQEYPIMLECPLCGHYMNFKIEKKWTLEEIDKWANFDKQKLIQLVKSFKQYPIVTNEMITVRDSADNVNYILDNIIKELEK